MAATNHLHSEHAHSGHADPTSRKDRARLIVVLTITSAFFAIELGCGWYANSLALMSDAIHVLTDIAAVCLSLLTLWISARPASAAKTFGYLRAEILGALANGLFLWMIVLLIWFEAIRRLRNPEPVQGLAVIAVALLGFTVNSTLAWIARPRGGDGMAMRAAFVHVLSDLAGSAGVMVAGTLDYFWAFKRADPVASILIGVLVIYASWGIVREGLDVLMESVPAGLDLDALRRDLLAVNGAEEVHDLHVWCLGTRNYALAAHAVVAPDADYDQVLADMSHVLQSRFNIHHMTVQLERDSRREHEPVHY
jgi:cobalt-zinc-cadmium efflux system protein